MRDEVPEILQSAKLAYIKRDESAVFNHRSTSEPNLSDVVTDSSLGSTTDESSAPNGFPRACSLDSHLDEPAPGNNTDERPTVAERDIQMSDAVKELNQNDQSTEREIPDEPDLSGSSTMEEGDAGDSPSPGACAEGSEMTGVMECTPNVVSVELHLSQCTASEVEGKGKPPIPPPRKRKAVADLPSKQGNVSSTIEQADSISEKEKETVPSPKSDSSECLTIDDAAKTKYEKSPVSHREEWKKKMLKQHLPPDYMAAQPRNEEGCKECNVSDDLIASVDLDNVMDPDVIPDDDGTRVNQMGSVMSESMLVQSTCSVEERSDAISQPRCDSPLLTNRTVTHPVTMATRINSSIASSVSSGVAYEENDIDSILDKLSLASTFTDKDDARINTWEKIAIKEDSDKENIQNKTIINDNRQGMSKDSTDAKNKKQKVNFRSVESFKDISGDNRMESNSESANKKFKMKHRLRLDKAEKKKAKCNQFNRARESRSKEKISKRRPNTNSLDRDALKTGEYFSAGDLCDFVYSRSTSIEDSNGSKEIDTPKVEKYLYTDDNVWIPMGENIDNECVKENNDTAIETQSIMNDPKVNMKASLLTRQDATETFTHHCCTQDEEEKDKAEATESPWIRRTLSEDNGFVSPSVVYPKNTPISCSQETDLV